jgi:serine/threonine protein phosphatase 1
MRKLVISDIHGCYNEFRQLLKKVNYNPQRDQLILLGDYIDRGYNSYKTVKYIQTLQTKYNNIIALKGNHEDLLIQAINNHSSLNYYNWIINGGSDTKNSYNYNNKDIITDINWFKSLPALYQTDKYIFVHAGLKPRIKLKKQNEKDLLWIRDEFIYSKNNFGKTIVFGHTPVNLIDRNSSNIIMFNNKIAIDTGCCFNGKLSCLIITDDNKLTCNHIDYNNYNCYNNIKTIRSDNNGYLHKNRKQDRIGIL